MVSFVIPASLEAAEETSSLELIAEKRSRKCDVKVYVDKEMEERYEEEKQKCGSGLALDNHAQTHLHNGGCVDSVRVTRSDKQLEFHPSTA